ncbi:MAG: HIT domain-containing protein [Solirubrobacterales bacterium]
MANHRIWAPWRLDYVKSDKSGECIFCAKPARDDDDEGLIAHRGERCFVILNAFPYTNGHLMVSPYEHVGRIEQLDEATANELMSLAQRCVRALELAYGPQGYNLGANLGSVAGAGVEHHVHMHVVPRWKGDTNFMPVVGDVRVLPEELGDTLRNIREAFAKLETGA